MNTTCPELLKNLRLGQNPEVWDSFVRIYHKSVVRWIRQAGANPAEIEDIAQEAFLTVFRLIKDFERRKPGSFRSWIKTIIQLLVRHHASSRKTSKLALVDFDEMEIIEEDAGTLNDDRKELVNQAMQMIRGEFKDQSWEVFEQVYILEKSPREVAQAFGISVNSVYISTSRIMARLKTVVDQFIDAI